MSGGIRDDESLKAAMATGCRRVNIGTAALEQPEWCARPSPSTATGWPSASTSAAAPWPRAAGPARAATSTRCCPARLRGLRSLRRHRRQQGRHAPGPQPRPAPRRLRATDRPVVASGASPPSPTSRPSWAWSDGVEGAIAGTALYEGRFTLEDALALTLPKGGSENRGRAIAVRVIPCLDVDGGRVVKGINFTELRDAGDPSSWPARTTPRVPTS